jgi:5'-methylthioadenosine phosphorylase
MTDKIAIIGGSGLYNFDEIELIKEHTLETPFGAPSDTVKELDLNGHRFYFIPRHGVGHTLSPSEVNYRANIFALKKLGVKVVVSVSAVGSLKEEFAPGDFVLVDQFIDWTKGLRERTFFGDGFVGHVSVAQPVELALKKRIGQVLAGTDIKYHNGGSYLCIEGPQFSSKAESEIYRSFGASVIGMTNVPESYLAKEAGMAYATVAMVTDYDCWKEEHCTLEEILKVMGENVGRAQVMVKSLIPSLIAAPIEFHPENLNSVVTNKANLNQKHREIIDVLLG